MRRPSFTSSDWLKSKMVEALELRARTESANGGSSVFTTNTDGDGNVSESARKAFPVEAEAEADGYAAEEWSILTGADPIFQSPPPTSFPAPYADAREREHTEQAQAVSMTHEGAAWAPAASPLPSPEDCKDRAQQDGVPVFFECLPAEDRGQESVQTLKEGAPTSHAGALAESHVESTVHRAPGEESERRARESDGHALPHLGIDSADISPPDGFSQSTLPGAGPWRQWWGEGGGGREEEQTQSARLPWRSWWESGKALVAEKTGALAAAAREAEGAEATATTARALVNLVENKLASLQGGPVAGVRVSCDAERGGWGGGRRGEAREAFLAALSAQPIDLACLRRAGFFGVPDDRCDLRARYWKVVLGLLPLDNAAREARLRQRRDDFHAFYAEFARDLRRPAAFPAHLSVSEWRVIQRRKDQRARERAQKLERESVTAEFRRCVVRLALRGDGGVTGGEGEKAVGDGGWDSAVGGEGGCEEGALGGEHGDCLDIGMSPEEEEACRVYAGNRALQVFAPALPYV